VRILKLCRFLLLAILLMAVLESRASEPLNKISSLTNLSIQDGNQIDQDKDPLNILPKVTLLFPFNFVFLGNIKLPLTAAYTNPSLGPNLRPPSI
jgi:hypothetical protein